MVAKVYEAISKVSRVLATHGIAKTRKNQQQGFQYRGIDEVMNELSPLLADNRLCILPRILTRTTTERATQKGGTLYYTVVEAEFDFVSAEDGSKHTVRMFGEAMDSADKSTNKAMSAAYKYAAFQTFCIPVEGTPDADADSPEPLPPKSNAETWGNSKPATPPVQQPSKPATPPPAAPKQEDQSKKYDEVTDWIISQFDPETWQRSDWSMHYPNYRDDVIERAKGLPEHTVKELRGKGYYHWLTCMICTADQSELSDGTWEGKVNDSGLPLPRKQELHQLILKNREAFANAA